MAGSLETLRVYNLLSCLKIPVSLVNFSDDLDFSYYVYLYTYIRGQRKDSTENPTSFLVQILTEMLVVQNSERC